MKIQYDIAIHLTRWLKCGKSKKVNTPELLGLLCWGFKGIQEETIEEMKEAVTKVIDMLIQQDFHGAFQKLLEQYKCIAAGGDYFEGD